MSGTGSIARCAGIECTIIGHSRVFIVSIVRAVQCKQPEFCRRRKEGGKECRGERKKETKSVKEVKEVKEEKPQGIC